MQGRFPTIPASRVIPLRYHFGGRVVYRGRMAMTLRLTPAEDRALALLAATRGTSKQEAARRAIVDAAARSVRDAEVRRLAAETVEGHAALLRKLGK